MSEELRRKLQEAKKELRGLGLTAFVALRYNLIVWQINAKLFILQNVGKVEVAQLFGIVEQAESSSDQLPWK